MYVQCRKLSAKARLITNLLVWFTSTGTSSVLSQLFSSLVSKFAFIYEAPLTTQLSSPAPQQRRPSYSRLPVSVTLSEKPARRCAQCRKCLSHRAHTHAHTHSRVHTLSTLRYFLPCCWHFCLHHLQPQHLEPAQTPAQALKAEITTGPTGQINATQPPISRAAAGKPRAPRPPLHGSCRLHRCSAPSIPLPGRPSVASTLHFIFVAQFPPMTVHLVRCHRG